MRCTTVGGRLSPIVAPMSETPVLLAAIEPLAFLVGTWRGEGRGLYPTIDSFSYNEEIEFWHIGKPFLGYHQRTEHVETGLPLHTESGFWRVASPPDAPGAVVVEATITQPTGVCEVLVGTLVDQRVDLQAIEVVRTPTAKEVTAVERVITVVGDELRYEVGMAAVGHELLPHLEAVLHRV